MSAKSRPKPDERHRSDQRFIFQVQEGEDAGLLCAYAGHACSFSAPAKSPSAQTLHLRARIEWLTSFVNKNAYFGLSGVESIETGTDLESLLANTVSPCHGDKTTSTNTSSIAPVAAGSRKEGVACNDFVRFPKTQSHHDKGNMLPASLPHHRPSSLVTAVNSDSPASCHSRDQMVVNGSSDNSIATPRLLDIMEYREVDHSNFTVLAHDSLARRLVDAYFRNIHKAYSFVNKSKLLRNSDLTGTLARKRAGPDSTLLYLVMALGCTTLQKAGQIPQDVSSAFHIAYSEIIQESLTRQDEVESLQILVLLALYALFDPKGTSTWSIAGLAARQAFLAGLSRKELEEKTQPSSPTDTEFRYRLFWSILVLDRMAAISLGIQVALVDENMDVPLPGLTIDESTSPERQHYAFMLRTNRHIIQLRQLEDRILKQIHTRKRSEIAALSQADRQVIVEEIKSEMDNWYSEGCLESPLESENVSIHSSMTWLSARYYHLLLLLHYPCHFNSSGLIDEFLCLMRQVLGSSTCYAMYRLPDDTGAQDSFSTTGRNGANSQTLSSLPVESAVHVSSGTIMPSDDYGWIDLELGFL